MSEIPATMWRLQSLVTAEGELRLSMASVETPRPGKLEVLVRVEAAPINPSDLLMLLAMADVSAAVSGGSTDEPLVTAPIPETVMSPLTARVGQAMPVGIEGSGVVVAVGQSPEARALLGCTVGFLGGATYGQYCLASVRMCVPLPEGTAAVDGASSFVNPLTALGMVETMRREGHTGLVHTAAASNLGQMLNRICLADDVPLVNVVRRPEQVALLREQGARHVCDSSEPTFEADLFAALLDTDATLAFDAVGGGPLAGQILNAMERGRRATRRALQPLRERRAQAGLRVRRFGPATDRAAPSVRLRLGRRSVTNLMSSPARVSLLLTGQSGRPFGALALSSHSCPRAGEIVGLVERVPRRMTELS